ncbi:MAG TPA: CusA/CzcA family heavy metal efflux RND transporter, partial [Cyanobacteria bacterium UBA11162]|nr:CusA/CzcA family heavy metal efflux RND transporter [Cyanobacteria bacterium UBA11162]
MFSTILRWVINRRWLVVIATVIITLWTIYVIPQMQLDVFPPFAPPQVEIQTEAPGLAPEEVESLVTLPIESAINGTPGVTAVRSSSAVGLSVVKVIFDWGTDIYQARQLVTERLQQATSKLPEAAETPQLSPTTSPVGTILTYAFTSETTPLMEVRRIVDWQVTNRLLAVPGVAQVVAYGGDVRQYQVLVDPTKLQAFDVSLQDVTEAVQAANTNAPGGYLITPDQETLIRGVGRIETLEDLNYSAITSRQGTPVRIADVADVQIDAAIKRGDGSLNGKKAVIVMVNRQPNADTPT